jgi:hypothetical protein
MGGKDLFYVALQSGKVELTPPARLPRAHLTRGMPPRDAYRYSSEGQMRETQHGGQVGTYRFDWTSPLLAFGCCNGLKLPFVWNILDSATTKTLFASTSSAWSVSTRYATERLFSQLSASSTPTASRLAIRSAKRI